MSQLGLSLIALGLFFDNNLLAVSFAILNFIVYIFTSLIFFIILFLNLNTKTSTINKFENTKFSLAELSHFNTYFSFLLTLNVLSMAGIPPLFGFFPKYLILSLFSTYSPLFVFCFLILHLINTFNYLRLIQIF
jgi:NADH:ubiquinone oxidoreductase subunit 2 (subunit N)